MKRLLLFPLLALALAACSAHTSTEVRVDVVSYLKASGVTLNQTLPSGVVGSVYIPDNPPQSGYPVALPTKLDFLESGRLQLTATLTGNASGATANTITVEARIGAEADTNLFDSVNDFQIVSKGESVGPGTIKTLTIDEDISTNASVFNLIKGGKFKIALRIGATGGTEVTFLLTKLNVSVSGKLFKLIPKP